MLEVADLEDAVSFYSEILGLPLASRSDERAWFMVGSGARLGLWTPQVGIAGGQGGAHVHYAMHIAAEDYNRTLEHLREQGLDPHEENFEENGRALYVTDPDGHVVELWTWQG